MRAITQLTRLLLLTSLLFLQGSLAHECTKELPHLAAGHIQLTDSNHKAWKKDNSKLHVLGTSDSSCSKCCQSEAILAQLKEKFDSKVYTGKKGKKIQIARADISHQYNFFKTEGIPTDDAPAIFVMHEGKYYRYNLDSTKSAPSTYDDISGIIHLINRLQHPLLPLDSEAAIEQFLDTSIDVVETTGFLKRENPSLGNHYAKLKYKTRVLVFMFDKDEYVTEMKIVRDSGRLNGQRLSIRYGLVTDPKLIRLYKGRKGNQWFVDEVQLSSIVVQRFDKQTFGLDMMGMDNINVVTHLINKKSLLPVTELDPEAGRLLEMVGQQVLVGVTGFSTRSRRIVDESKDLVDKTLNALAPALFRGMMVASVEYSYVHHVMEQLGLTEEDLPFIYVSDTETQRPIRYRGQLEENEVRKWAQDILKNMQAGVPTQLVHRPHPVNDDTLVPTFKAGKVTVLEERSQLDDMLSFEGDDICIFTFSTTIDDDLNRMVIDMFANLAAEVRKNTKRLKFVAYDLNTLGPHDSLEISHPSVFLSPGNQRDKKPRIFRGDSGAETIAEWLKTHSSNQFKMKTKNLDMQLKTLKYAQDMGLGQDNNKPEKNIMTEIEEELMRRGEL